jgi:NAD-dependent dihydropyrimidine dehydrogenase PreA subunit
MKRKIITIDQEKCNGCGLCIPNCPEGAIQIIDEKARLVSDLFCDGLGACIGHCPEGAIKIEEREAVPYDEAVVFENIIKHGANTIQAHLEHLREHGEDEYLNIATGILEERGIEYDKAATKADIPVFACPGSQSRTIGTQAASGPAGSTGVADVPSRLTHWPVQLHLISPQAAHFRGKDVVLSADCVAYAMGNFHEKYLKDKAVTIACPKLDDSSDIYIEKIKALIDNAEINTLSVMTMEVPCCTGLLMMAKEAVARADRHVPVKHIQVGIAGEVQKESWLPQAG